MTAEPRDIPIIFSGAMVRAQLDGTKTMTRRLASSPLAKARPGDRLWVREAWGAPDADRPGTPDGRKPKPGDRIVYAANDDDAWQWRTGHPGCGDFCWRPSIHMPRWASRLTLEVTAVKVERLQDISEEDATAEGARTVYGEPFFAEGNTLTDRRRFQLLWDSLHGADAWAANPWVCAISFTVHRANIDAMASSPALPAMGESAA